MITQQNTHHGSQTYQGKPNSLKLKAGLYTNGSARKVKFYALQDIDVGVRLRLAFCKEA